MAELNSTTQHHRKIWPKKKKRKKTTCFTADIATMLQTQEDQDLNTFISLRTNTYTSLIHLIASILNKHTNNYRMMEKDINM
jgi:hypothetical protein